MRELVCIGSEAGSAIIEFVARMRGFSENGIHRRKSYNQWGRLVAEEAPSTLISILRVTMTLLRSNLVGRERFSYHLTLVNDVVLNPKTSGSIIKVKEAVEVGAKAVEYFRGSDFTRFVNKNPQLMRERVSHNI